MLSKNSYQLFYACYDFAISIACSGKRTSDKRNLAAPSIAWEATKKDHRLMVFFVGSPNWVSENKTIKYRFIEAKSTKLGVAEQNYICNAATMRLDGRVAEPVTRAYCLDGILRHLSCATDK